MIALGLVQVWDGSGRRMIDLVLSIQSNHPTVVVSITEILVSHKVGHAIRYILVNPGFTDEYPSWQRQHDSSGLVYLG